MKFTLALCQSMVQIEKEKNLENAAVMVRDAAAKGAQVVALPEMFNTPYSNKHIVKNSEKADGPSVAMLSNLAEECGIYLIGGSIPEEEGEKLYNTCFCFSPKGELIGKHRKAHLFDVDIKGGIRFMESEVLTGGDSSTIIETPYCPIGIGICYDVRFPELFRKMTLAGAKLIVLPAAFNMTTGPAHWDLTMRARALDNQIYFAAVSPARSVDGPYQAYGSSCVVSPWGAFCAKLDQREGTAFAEIDLEYLDRVRQELPLLAQRRPELY